MRREERGKRLVLRLRCVRVRGLSPARGYKNPSNALQVHVDPEDKTTYPIQVSGSNYKTNTTFVNESGLYSLILSSKLPQAKAFKRWVTSEVLPQIRQTGRSGDGESTLRVWQNRGYIVYDDVCGRFCKTETYKQKLGGKV